MPLRLPAPILVVFLCVCLTDSFSSENNNLPAAHSPENTSLGKLDEFGREIIPFSHLEERPVPIFQPSPVYPVELKKDGIQGRVIIEFILNSEGKVSSPVVIRSTDKRFEEAAVQAISKWEFKPGKNKGQVVATRLRAPIEFQLGGSAIAPSKGFEADIATVERIEQARKAYPVTTADKPPTVISKPDPKYPFKMRYAGLSGEVIVDFIIDENGNVQTAYAKRSTHRGFEDEAVSAIQKWKFAPIKIHDQPANIHTQVPIIFENPEPISFLKPTLDELTKINKLRLAYPVAPVETPAIAIYSPQPEYPNDLRQAKIEGAVTVDMIVDDKGNVQTPYATLFSNRSLATLAIEAVKKWKFKPGTKDGKPVNDNLAVTLFFEVPRNTSAKPK